MFRKAFLLMICVNLLVAVLVATCAHVQAADVPNNLTSSLRVTTSSTTYYVMPGADGECNSWADACDLQVALGKVKSGDQIWVTEGLYYPGVVVTDTFQLKDGVALYGGFPAGGGDWNQRDWIVNQTILSGDIDQNDLTNNGVVTATVNITGTNAYHVVSSQLLTTAVLDGFTITAGNAYGSEYLDPDSNGGGLYNNSSNVTLIHVIFSGNMASWMGGGIINNDGTIILKSVFFNNNLAINGEGGGLYNISGIATLTDVTFSGNIAWGGGGISNYYDGTITLINVGFYNNENSIIHSGGGGIVNLGTTTLTNVTFSGNSGAGEGGGICNLAGGTVKLIDVAFNDNQANGSGGGLFNGGDATLMDVSFSNNQADKSGGGMVNGGDTATLIRVVFNDNQTNGSGGGLFNLSTVTLTNVAFSGNMADHDGGGMVNVGGSAMLTNVTFFGNSAVNGGGIDNLGSSPTIANVTFSGNMASWMGGGIYNENSSPTLSNVTFFDNSATQNGGGIYNYGYDVLGGSYPILTNAILWGNSPNQISFNAIISATVTYSDIQGGWEGDGNINLDPLLEPLADNGGFTLTHALEEGSPAIDTGSPATCLLTDQRGYLRTFDGDGDGVAVCDMGAFEYGSIPPLMQYLPVVVK